MNLKLFSELAALSEERLEYGTRVPGSLELYMVARQVEQQVHSAGLDELVVVLLTSAAECHLVRGRMRDGAECAKIFLRLAVGVTEAMVDDNPLMCKGRDGWPVLLRRLIRLALDNRRLRKGYTGTGAGTSGVDGEVDPNTLRLLEMEKKRALQSTIKKIWNGLQVYDVMLLAMMVAGSTVMPGHGPQTADLGVIRYNMHRAVATAPVVLATGFRFVSRNEIMLDFAHRLYPERPASLSVDDYEEELPYGMPDSYEEERHFEYYLNSLANVAVNLPWFAKEAVMGNDREAAKRLLTSIRSAVPALKTVAVYQAMNLNYPWFMSTLGMAAHLLNALMICWLMIFSSMLSWRPREQSIFGTFVDSCALIQFLVGATHARSSFAEAYINNFWLPLLQDGVDYTLGDDVEVEGLIDFGRIGLAALMFTMTVRRVQNTGAVKIDGQANKLNQKSSDIDVFTLKLQTAFDHWHSFKKPMKLGIPPVGLMKKIDPIWLSDDDTLKFEFVKKMESIDDVSKLFLTKQQPKGPLEVGFIDPKPLPLENGTPGGPEV